MSVYVHLIMLALILFSFIHLNYTDTTDVQNVTVNELENNSFLVECHFMMNSTPYGCMVVITSVHYEDVVLNLTRMSNSQANSVTVQDIVKVNRPAVCYKHVSGFDIESNGAIGSLPIPGQLVMNSEGLCSGTNIATVPIIIEGVSGKRG